MFLYTIKKKKHCDVWWKSSTCWRSIFMKNGCQSTRVDYVRFGNYTTNSTNPILSMLHWPFSDVVTHNSAPRNDVLHPFAGPSSIPPFPLTSFSIQSNLHITLAIHDSILWPTNWAQRYFTLKLLFSHTRSNPKHLTLYLTPKWKFDFPKFNRVDPHGWLHRCEEFFLYHSMPEHRKVHAMGFNLEGECMGDVSE